MSEHKFWLRIIYSVACVLVTLIVGCFGSCSYTDYLVAQEIKAGVDPIAASCAHHDQSRTIHCALPYVQKK